MQPMAAPSIALTAISDRAAALRESLVTLRRELHAHPELSGEERRTAELVVSRLRSLGLEVEERIGGYGVVGVLTGAHPGPTVAYRADMDALPIQEEASDRPYASLVLGVSHACGHDVHVAIALGVAEVLAGLRDSLRGSIVFVFQPAEESLDGARAMIAAGLLDRYRPAAMLALHTSPLQVGTVGIAEDLCLAGMEEFRVRFYAPGADLDTMVREAVVALESLSTSNPPQDAAQFQALARRMEAGSGLERTVFLSCWPNVDEAMPSYHMLGLASIADFALRPALQRQIRCALDHVTRCHGATYDLAVTFVNPPLRNDHALVAQVRPVVERLLGHENVLSFRDPYPYSHEDLSLFAAQIPTALLWVGSANVAGSDRSDGSDRNIPSLLHTPDYDVDEDALVVGTQTATAALLHLTGAAL